MSCLRRLWATVATVLTGLLGAGCSSLPPGVSSMPGSTRVLVALALKVDAPRVATLADATADPANPGFRRFRTVGSIASANGAPPSVISTDLRRLEKLGIRLHADASHGALWGTVTAAQVERYFGTRLVRAEGLVEPLKNPKIPPGLEGVTGVIGLVASATSPPPPTSADGSAEPECPSAVPSRTSIAQRFGFPRALAAGLTGEGTSVAILAVHDLEPATFANFDRCGGSGTETQIARARVPLTHTPTGGPEVALDGLILTLLAPQTKLSVIDFDGGTPLAFPLTQLLGGNGSPPNVLDITVDYCESQLSGSELALSEWELSVLAATGTSVIAAAGDTGSSGCYPPTRTASVTYPASSQFVTGAGGVSYDGSAESPRQLQVWNQPGEAGGGGGTSSRISAPPWQRSRLRMVPDLAANAQPGAAGEIPVCVDSAHCKWELEGGTSVSATALSAISMLLAGATHPSMRWGNLAARLWRRGSALAALRDVTIGANTTFTASCCNATRGYDRASGWGLFVPDQLRGSLFKAG